MRPPPRCGHKTTRTLVARETSDPKDQGCQLMQRNRLRLRLLPLRRRLQLPTGLAGSGPRPSAARLVAERCGVLPTR